MTITGSNLCNGTPGDVTSVTLAGILAAVQSVSGSTQIVVTAGAGTAGISGAAVVESALHGQTTFPNAFAYGAPQMQVLGTNRAVIASGDEPARATGANFGLYKAGEVATNVFAVTNTGLMRVEIDGVGVEEP